MKIIIGLGNTGKKYDRTRHNVGFMALDYLAETNGLVWKTNKKFKAEIAELDGDLLAKPTTFMNSSGEAVATILNFYKLTAADIVIIHDDLDIDFGKYKVAVDSRAAGHNGVQSIMDILKTKKIKRIRVGIRQKLTAGNKIDASHFVLQKFTKEELNAIKKLFPIITEEIKKG